MAADGNAADKLRGYLRELKPEARALLIAQLERKLARGEKVPGADIILEELGGASRAEMSPEPTSPEQGVSEAVKSPMRTADPATLFFAFFEAFIVDDVAEYEHPGRIARACVMPIWEWICRDVLPDEAKTFADEAMGAAMAGDTASFLTFQRPGCGIRPLRAVGLSTTGGRRPIPG